MSLRDNPVSGTIGSWSRSRNRNGSRDRQWLHSVVEPRMGWFTARNPPCGIQQRIGSFVTEIKNQTRSSKYQTNGKHRHSDPPGAALSGPASEAGGERVVPTRLKRSRNRVRWRNRGSWPIPHTPGNVAALLNLNWQLAMENWQSPHPIAAFMRCNKSG